MPTLQEVSHGLYGAWRLVCRDPRAMDWFDHSVAGVLRSFWAGAICYPGFLLLQLMQIDTAPLRWTVLLQYLVVSSIGYVIGWTAYPLTALPFCRWIAPEERALGFIAAYNWAQVLQTGLVLVVSLFGMLHLVPIYGIAYVQTVAYLAILVYEWFIARIALEAGGAAATALVLLDVVLTAFLTQLTMLLAGQSPG
jgi:hypothetical protein